MSDFDKMQEDTKIVVKEKKTLEDLEKEVTEIKITLNELINKIKVRNF